MSSTSISQPPPRTIRLAQAGDDPARDELVIYCRRTAFVFALQGCRDRQEAQDVAQDAVVRVLTALDRFKADLPVRPWLLKIVRNLLADRGRRSRVRKAVPLNETAGGTGVIVDPGPGPEAEAARRELQRTVWAALRRLDAKDREIVTLRDYLDLSYEEIAHTLSIPRGTVMSRLHRARSRLRRALRTAREVRDD